MEAAAIPLPRPDSTPPVTTMYLQPFLRFFMIKLLGTSGLRGVHGQWRDPRARRRANPAARHARGWVRDSNHAAFHGTFRFHVATGPARRRRAENFWNRRRRPGERGCFRPVV